MCWLVSIAAPQKHRQAMERITQASRGLQIIWFTPTSETSQFPGTTCCAQVVRGGCSCDIYTSPRTPGREEEELDRERDRLQKKGWSAAKIDRALHNKSDSATRPRRPRKGAEAFNALVTELVRGLGSVYLHAHFANDPHDEPAAATVISLQQFLELGFPANTVVTVR